MRLTWFTLLLLLLIAVPGAAAQETDEADVPQPGYLRLRDLPLFVDQPLDQWAGSGGGMSLEIDDYASLPVERGAANGGGPAYRVSVSGQNGWWIALLAGPNWVSYSIAPYVPEGALVFDVRGAAGGEDLKIVLNDTVAGRSPENLPSTEALLSDFATLTTEWQTVRIPLAAFMASAGGFNQEQLFTVAFSAANGEPLTVWLSNIRFSSPTIEPASPAIKLNQTGYLPAAPKIARVSGFDELLTAQVGTPFAVRDLSSKKVLFEGALTLISPFDGGVSGERVLAADFSTLTTPGSYYLTVDAYQVDDSPPFIIGSDVYDGLLIDVQRYYYLQRSGIPLDDAYAGTFARPAGHPQDVRAALRSGFALDLDVSGGWYDAGDYGKYVNAGATAVSDLLWAYEMFPDMFADGTLNIPESGNGVADLLDEVRWELDWIRKMQDSESGGFFYAVQPTEQTAVPRARGARYVEDVDGTRTQVKPTSITASAVGALAHGVLAFGEVDPEYAAALRSAAERGWAYLEAHPEGVAPVPGPYEDSDDSQERLWAAAALFRATGAPQYDDYFRKTEGSVKSFFVADTDNAYGVGNMEMIAWLHYIHSAAADPATLAAFRERYTDWSARMMDRWEASAWSLTLLDEDFYWGSNYVTLTTPLVMMVGARGLGLPETDARGAALAALDYLLGANPLRFSYISGYGEDSLQWPFSAQWSADGVTAVPAGILAGGPNAYTNQLLFSNFPARRYVDSSAEWTVNEHTIYWNAALVFNVALAAEIGRTAPPSAPAAGATAATLSAPPDATDIVRETPAPLVAVAPASSGTPAAETAGSDPLLRGLVGIGLAWLAALSILMVVFWRRLQRR